MPAALAKAIADHLAADVANSPLPTALINDDFLPDFDLADLNVCRVSVSPLRRSASDSARGHASYEPSVAILSQIRCKLTDEGKPDRAAVENFINFVLWIDLALQETRTLAGRTWASSEIDPLYDDELLRSNSILRSLITPTYRILRRF